MAISEYDAFGPWIYEIDDEHPVPRLFAPYIPAEPPELLFKIPRSIERRVATPDMDLYDCVVGAYATHICILERQERSVLRQEVLYSDIEGLCLTRHFLKGILRLYTRTGETTIAFNTVSVEIVKRFMSLLRSKQPRTAPLPETLRQQQTALDLNPLFTNMLKDLRADGETPLLWAYQPIAERIPMGGAGLAGLLERLQHKKLPATLHVLTPKDLIVIRQDAAEDRHAKEKFIYHYYYLPLAALRGAALRADETRVGQLCVLELPHHSLQFPVEAEARSVPALYACLRRYVK